MSQLTNRITKTESDQPEHCKGCESCYSKNDDWTYLDKKGLTGNIVKEYYCAENDEYCPEVSAYCEKIQESKIILPKECQICESCKDCHYKKLNLVIGLIRINICKNVGMIK